MNTTDKLLIFACTSIYAESLVNFDQTTALQLRRKREKDPQTGILSVSLLARAKKRHSQCYFFNY